MMRRGISLLVLTLAVCLPASQIPFVGALFVFPFADLILVAFALILAAPFPVAGKSRMLLIVSLWVALSLGIELVRIPHIIANDGVLSPHITIDRQTPLSDAGEVILRGDLNTLLVAGGPVGFVQQDMNIAGMRESAGLVMQEQAATTDIPDLIWLKGIRPIFGREDFPAIEVRQIHNKGWIELTIKVKDGPNSVAAQFTRSASLPRPEGSYPRTSAPMRLLLSVLNDNLIRAVLGLNTPLNLNSEVSSFLDTALDRVDRREASIGPRIELHETSSKLHSIPLSEYMQHHRETIGSGKEVDSPMNRVQACGMTMQGREFGERGRRTYVEVLDFPELPYPTVLRHISPMYSTFEYYCNAADETLTTFTQIGEQPTLKLSTYSKRGTLLAVAYYKLPRFLNRFTVVHRGTLRQGLAEVSLSVSAPIKSKGDSRHEFDESQVEEITFSSIAAAK